MNNPQRQTAPLMHARVRSAHRAYLLILTALGEGAIGLLLLIVPSIPLWILFGLDQVSQPVEVLARMAGAALVALSIACWTARNDQARPAQQSIILGLLIYDLAAATVLAYAGSAWSLTGVALWPAVALHTALAGWCVVSL